MEETRDEKIGNLIISKYDELKAIRDESNWNQKLVAASYVHRRDNYIGTEVAKRRTYDSHPKAYILKYESGLTEYLTPQDDEWAMFVPKTGIGKGTRRDSLSIEKAQMEALEAITSIVFQSMTDSNFYKSLYEVSLDRDVFGVGYLYVIDGWDAGKNGLVYMCIDPQECVIADDILGMCEVFIRKINMSAVDIIRTYGNNAKLPIVRSYLGKSGSESAELTVYEAIMPNDYLYNPETFSPERIGNGKKFAHIVYVEVDHEIVDESGFDEMPVAVSRRNGNSDKMPYGIGLIEDCLEEIVKLNDLSNLRQTMVQTAANPPMWIPNSMRGRFSGNPGKINYGPDGSDKPQPVVTTTNPSLILNDIQDLRQTLRNLIPVDLFETIMGSTDSRKTATEVSMKKNEAMILLASQIGNIKRDLLEIVFKRSARIAIKHLSLPIDVQQGLRKYLYNLVEQSRLELNSVFIRRLSAYLQNVGDDEIFASLMSAYNIYPQVMDIIQIDDFMAKWLRGKGMLSSLLSSKQQIDNARKARAEIQKEQLNAELGEMDSKANMNNAKAMQAQGSRA